MLSCFFLICGNLQGQKLQRLAPRVDKDVAEITEIAVPAINRSMKSTRRDPYPCSKSAAGT